MLDFVYLEDVAVRLKSYCRPGYFNEPMLGLRLLLRQRLLWIQVPLQ